MIKMETEYKNKVLRLYEEATKEQDPLLRKLRIAFCIVLIEDRKLLEKLMKE